MIVISDVSALSAPPLIALEESGGPFVRVHENVSFHPGIGAVEVQNIIARANKDVVEKLHYRPRPVASREIHDVVVADRHPKEIVQENPLPSRFYPTGSMDQLKLSGGAGKYTVLDNEGGAVQREVLLGSVPKREMIEE